MLLAGSHSGSAQTVYDRINQRQAEMDRFCGELRQGLSPQTLAALDNAQNPYYRIEQELRSFNRDVWIIENGTPAQQEELMRRNQAMSGIYGVSAADLSRRNSMAQQHYNTLNQNWGRTCRMAESRYKTQAQSAAQYGDYETLCRALANVQYYHQMGQGYP